MSDITITIAIHGSPQQVWHALVDADTTPAYYLGFRAEFDDLTAGAPYRYTAGGGTMISGRIHKVEALRRLDMTFNGAWEPNVAALAESEVSFVLIDPFMPMPGVTFLSCTHRDLPDGPVRDHLELGWVTILSGLKTLIETGAPMLGAAA